jgi:hypothetical protein
MGPCIASNARLELQVGERKTSRGSLSDGRLPQILHLGSAGLPNGAAGFLKQTNQHFGAPEQRLAEGADFATIFCRSWTTLQKARFSRVNLLDEPTKDGPVVYRIIKSDELRFVIVGVLTLPKACGLVVPCVPIIAAFYRSGYLRAIVL